jgi:hypothetical protein
MFGKLCASLYSLNSAAHRGKKKNGDYPRENEFRGSAENSEGDKKKCGPSYVHRFIV